MNIHNTTYVMYGLNALLWVHCLYVLTYKEGEACSSRFNAGEAGASSVSEIQSRYSRTNLTFILTALGTVVTVHTGSLVHMSLPLMCLFPLKSSRSKEIVICFPISTDVSNRVHYALVINYVILYPIVFIGHWILPALWVLFIVMLHFNVKPIWCVMYELALFTPSLYMYT